MEQHDIYERLRRASAADKAVYINPPCNDVAIARFRDRARLVLGTAEWYVPLLRLTDGLQIDHSILVDADEFVRLNQERRADDPAIRRYVVFGSSGNVDQYVYDSETSSAPFVVANFYDAGDVYERFPTLEALLGALLDATVD